MSHISMEEHNRRRILLGQAKNDPAPDLAEKALRYLHGMVVRNVPFVHATLADLEAQYAEMPARIEKLRKQLAEESYLAGATNDFPPHLPKPEDEQAP